MARTYKPRRSASKAERATATVAGPKSGSAKGQLSAIVADLGKRGIRLEAIPLTGRRVQRFSLVKAGGLTVIPLAYRDVADEVLANAVSRESVVLALVEDMLSEAGVGWITWQRTAEKLPSPAPAERDAVLVLPLSKNFDHMGRRI